MRRVLSNQEDEMKIVPRRIAGAFLALGTLFLGAGVLLSQTPSIVKEMSLQKDGNRLLIQLKVEGTYAVEASFLPSPPRLVIDMTSISESQVLPLTQINDTAVIDVRIGKSKADAVQAVFNFSAPAPDYEIAKTDEGLKIAFWYEGGVPPAPAPIQAEPAKSDVPKAAAAPAPAMPAEPGRSGYVDNQDVNEFQC